MSRVLGVDLGTKTIGVAVSDELGLIAQGLPTLTRGEPEEDLTALGELIRRFEVEEVVIGLPRHLDGRFGEEAETASAFARMLEGCFRIRTILWDERWTTKAADRFLIEAGVRRKKRRQVVDRIAAILILQGYLDSRSKSEEGHAG